MCPGVIQSPLYDILPKLFNLNLFMRKHISIDRYILKYVGLKCYNACELVSKDAGG